MKILVGYSGFVGSNIAAQYRFDALYNSKNITDAFGTNPDLCIYSGVRAEMFLANSDPEADLAVIKDAIDNIVKINPKRLVLISTVAVYDNPVRVDEDTRICEEKSKAYGKNRRYLEKWVEENMSDYLIVRLPAIYGINLKKNFIYDIINVSPALLKENKFNELCAKDDFIKDYYIKQDNGFYKCTDSKAVKSYFQHIGFSAVNFTDSRSVYQFYNLKNLSSHLDFAEKNGIRLLNIATQPVSAGEVYEFLFNKEFINEVSPSPFNYDMRTKYFDGGYILDKTTVLEDIKSFVEVGNR